MAGGEERRAVVVCVYHAIFINPCYWFQHAFKATLRCFGFDSEQPPPPPPPPPPTDVHECVTEPLIVASSGSDDHKHNNREDQGNHDKPVAESRGLSLSSSSSSSSSSGEDDQEQADLQPYTTDDPPPSPDPISELSDTSVLALRRSRMPPRPPVSSGRGGQTN